MCFYEIFIIRHETSTQQQLNIWESSKKIDWSFDTNAIKTKRVLISSSIKLGKTF